jgi:hypothetical protein
LTPYVFAVGAAETGEREQQRRRSVSERLVRELAGHRVAWRSLTSAAATPAVELALLDTTGKYPTIRLEALTDHLQPKLVETTERAQIRAHEGSVKHVEVFRMVGVRTPIIGRPRPSPRHRRARHYTLNPEEPVKPR